MGLTPYYRLIPIHTAHWRKAHSPLQRRRECLYMPVNHPGHFFMLLHVCLYAFCLICEVVWIPSGRCCMRHCGYLLSNMILLLLSAFFMCLHLSMTSSITIRVSALWRQFVLIIFFIFQCFSALSVVAHGHLMRVGLFGCGLMTEHVADA